MTKRGTFGFILFTVLFLGACKQGDGNTPTPKIKELILSSMTIHKVKVENNKVTISEEIIQSGNIVAIFNYKGKNEEISVIVKDGTFTVDKSKPSNLELSVEAVKDEHSGWKGTIEVTYEAGKKINLSEVIILNVNNKLSKRIISDDDLLPEEFISHLTDGSTPELTVVNSQTPLSVIFNDTATTAQDSIISSIEFDINGTKLKKSPKRPDENLPVWTAERMAEFSDKAIPLVVTITVTPRNKTKYEGVVYKFQLKTKGIMELGIGYNGRYYKNGNEEALNTDVVELLVQSYVDIIKTVSVRVGEGATHTPEVKKYKNQLGVDFWSANLKLPIGNTPTIFTITVMPKNDRLYNNTVYTFKLKGTAALEDNAEFAFVGDTPSVGGVVTFKPGCESKYANVYGAKK